MILGKVLCEIVCLTTCIVIVVSFLLGRFVDAAIYFWLPQINITLIRLWQGRDLKHRMVGRTVVIGDIPWVAQCAEAFLSKVRIFTQNIVCRYFSF